MTGGRRARAVAAIAAFLVAVPAVADRPPGDPVAWLTRMTAALERVNYTGTLVELDDDGASVMRVVHRYDGSTATERLTALDDVGREIIHRGNEVTAILPDQRAVLVDRRDDVLPPASPIRNRFPGTLAVPAAHYRLAAGPGGDLLGRATWRVEVRPLDGLRYGYRLWLDEATAIPLKVQVVGEDGAILEQVLFAEIRFDEPVPAAAVEPTALTDGFAVRDGAGGAGPAAGTSSPDGGHWVAERLPPGFALRAVRSKAGRMTGARLLQLVYSDGVASVSVFVEPEPEPEPVTAPAPDAAPAAGAASRLGADSVYTRVVDGRRITAMGEVPARTAELIARAMRPAPAVR